MRTPLQKTKLNELLNERLGRNVLLSGGQAIVAAVVMFLAYRVFLREVGLERMGLWSLLLASASAARLADVTGAGGLSRFVAQAREDGRDAAIYVHTLTLATLALYTMLSILLYAFAEPLLRLLVEPDSFEEARTLVPLAVVTGLILNPIGSMLTSGIDGTRRADQRAILVSFSYVVFLAVVLATVPVFGIWAWGWALVCQQIVVIVGAWVILRHHIEGMWFFPYRWSNSVLGETVKYGLKLQANASAGMLSDPLAKYFLSRFGGLEAVGLYDLAARLVLAFRGVIVQMAMPIVPEFAALHRDHEKITELLRKARGVVARSAIVYVVGILLSAPLYSLFMFGELKMDLILIVAVLALGYGINTMAIPHYFAGVGLNKMRWNVGSQFLMAASIVLLSIWLGPRFATAGVISAVFFGLVGGAIMIMIGNSYALRHAIEPQSKN